MKTTRQFEITDCISIKMQKSKNGKLYRIKVYDLENKCIIKNHDYKSFSEAYHKFKNEIFKLIS